MPEQVIEKFDDLLPEIQEQLKNLAPRFKTDPRVLDSAKFIKREMGIKNDEEAICLGILKVFDAGDLLRRKLLKELFAYDGEGRKVILDKILTKGKIKRVCLIRGTLINPIDKKDPSQVIVKWYQSSHKDTSFEISMYKQLRARHSYVPWFSSRFVLFASPVLIMKPLLSVGPEDNEFEMGAQILEQLKAVHNICIHSDIKPPNIMKEEQDVEETLLGDIRKTKPHGKEKTYRYILIDYGGVSTERMPDHGEFAFRRAVWSPKWTSQEPHKKNQVTYPYHDFIELGFTMKSIQNMRTGDKAIKHDFHGKLGKYMREVKRIGRGNVSLEEYDKLIEILRE